MFISTRGITARSLLKGKRLLAHELTHVVQQGDAQSPQSAIQEQKVSPNNVIQRSPLSLTNDERIEIRRQTGNRIDRAFTAYIAAVEANRAAIKEKARQSASFVEMIIEVAFGLAAPGLAGGIAALARRLPANASLTAYRISIIRIRRSRGWKDAQCVCSYR